MFIASKLSPLVTEQNIGPDLFVFGLLHSVENTMNTFRIRSCILYVVCNVPLTNKR